MSLPPFNPDATCPKCRYDDISARWRLRQGDHVYLHAAHDWLSRCCKRCGYIWDEAVLDAPADEVGADDREPSA